MTHAPTSILARIVDPSRARRTAVIDARGRWSYARLALEAAAWRDRLVAAAPGRRGSLAGERVAYLAPPGRDHVAVQLGVWAAGAAAVPLAVSHPLRELEYVLDDSRPGVVAADFTHPRARSLAAAAAARRMAVVELVPSSSGSAASATVPLRGPAPGDPAQIVYTSGTTGRPKGVVATHGNLAAQIEALTSAWGWTADDRILHTLPLHHVHGLVNALACALWSGAVCEFGAGGSMAVWDRLAAGGITLFMSVPTVYDRLIRAWEEAPAEARRRWSRGAAGLRLMVSGSAALPAATLERWRELTGHVLLERYGMTEIGMALSNPLRGERRAGSVGEPLPGVEVRVVDDDGRPVARGGQGEIEVRGPQVFGGYWERPGETAAAFRDGWFRTGDEGVEGRDGYYRILGRRSADIVKTGGYKVSALEVEEVYREHPGVRDVAVVGAPDAEWGERVCAAWVPTAGSGERGAGGADAGGEGAGDGGDADAGAAMREWGKERLAPYKVPRRFEAVEELPRNAMGKVRKDVVQDMFTGGRDEDARREEDARRDGDMRRA